MVAGRDVVVGLITDEAKKKKIYRYRVRGGVPFIPTKVAQLQVKQNFRIVGPKE